MVKKTVEYPVILSILLVFIFSQGSIFAQNADDYRVSANGNWNAVATWQRYDGTNWLAAGATPTNTNGQITVPAGFNVTVSANVTADQLVVDGNITINTGRTLDVVNGAGTDLLVNAGGGTININGRLRMNGGASGSISGTINNANNFQNTANVTFNAGGTYNHNRDGGNIPNATYSVGSFTNVTGVTSTVPTGMNRIFANFTWDCASQSANITATTNANIHGDFTITNTNGNDFILNNNIDLNTNNFVVGANGVFNATTREVQGVANATISGTVKTANTNGFYGAGNTTIENSPALTLNAGSTIDYNAAGNQNITSTATMGTNYSNLITSTSGTKTLAGDVTVNNDLNINAGTTLQVGNDDLNVVGTTIVSGTLDDNNVGGNTSLANVTMQAGTINHVGGVVVSGALTVASGTNTMSGTGGITITGATTINTGATLTNSGTGNNYYDGAVTNSGTWNSPGAIDIRFQNGLTNNGTMSTTGAGTYTFDQNDQNIAGSQPIIFQGPVNISNGETVNNTNSSGITFEAALTGLGGGSTFTNSNTVYYAHNSIPMATGTFDVSPANNNVYYSLNGNQPVQAATYQNLFIAGSGTKTANGAVTVQGNLSIASGTILDDNGNLITANGNITNDGDETGTGGIRITGGGAHTITGNGAFQILDVRNNTNLAATAASIGVDDLFLNGGTLAIDNNTLTINNSITVAGGTLSAIPAQSSITLNGAAAIDLPVSITGLNNFTLNNSGGSTLPGNLDVNGSLTLSQGALTTGANTLSVATSPTIGTGYLTGGINSTLRTFGAANISLPANLIQAGNTINLDIDGTGTVSSCLTTVENIDIINNGRFVLTCDISITGNIINRGAFDGRNFTTTFNRTAGGNQTINPPANDGLYNFGDIVINTSNQVVLGRNINVYGDWTLNGGGFSTDAATREVYFRGTGVQTIGGALSTTFARLRSRNTSLIISNDQYITNRLRFEAAGKIILGNSDLILSTSNIQNVDNNSFVVTNGTGRLVRSGAVGALTFPVAAENAGNYYYAPVTFPAGSNDAGVRAVYGQHPDNTCGSEYLNQYWNMSTLAGGNLALGNYTFQPTLGLIVGSPESAYYYGGSWTSGGVAVGTPTFTMNLAGPDFPIGANDEVDISGIDNTEPTVLSVTPNPAIVTAANVGASTFYITTVFSEAMDNGSAPNITLTPAQGATLTQQAGVWSTTTYTNDTYTLYYDVANSGVWVDNIDIDVANGADACGNLQVAASPATTFDIHMSCLNPADAGPTQNLCEAVPGGLLANTVMDASDPGAAIGTWTWSGPGAAPTFADINSNSTTITGMAQGTHIFTWTITGGSCDGDSDDVVIYNDQPTAADAGTPGESCDGTYLLGANIPAFGTGLWSVPLPSPVVFANNTLATTTASNLTNGTNNLTWTISKGACSSNDMVVITNNTVTIADAGVDPAPFCSSTVPALNGNTPVTGTGIWTVTGALPSIIDNPNSPNTGLTNVPRATSGPIVLRWTITQGGCDSHDEVNISNLSVTAFAGNDKPVCTNTDDYIFEGNNPAGEDLMGYPASGQWTNSTMPPVDITNTAQFNSTFSNLLPDDNTFRWTVTNGVCTEHDEVIITNNVPQISPDAGPDQALCSDFTNLAGNQPGVASGVNPYWTVVDGGGTFTNNTLGNTQVNGMEYYVGVAGPGYWQQVRTINRYRWIFNKNGCEIWDEVGVINAMPRPADAGTDQTVCWNEANLNAVDLGSGAMEHYWTQGDGCAVLPSNSATIIQPNEFNAHVTNIQTANTTFRWHKWVRVNCTGYVGDCPPVPADISNPAYCNAGRPNATEAGFPSVQCELWDEMVVFRTGTDLGRASAGANQINCHDYATLNASAPSATAPGWSVVSSYWTTVQGSGTYDDPSLNNTVVRGLTPSDDANYHNTLRWTIEYTDGTNTCISTDDVIVANGLPSTPAVNSPVEVCSSTTTLSATPPTFGSGTWSIIGGASETFISSQSCNNWTCNVTVENLTQGQNILRWTIQKDTYISDPFDATGDMDNVASGGCELWEDAIFDNNEIISNAGTNGTTCYTYTQLLGSNPDPDNDGTGGTGLWSSGFTGTIVTPTRYNTQITGLDRGLNTFNWHVEKGNCSDDAEVVITSNWPGSPDPSVPEEDICVDYTNLNATVLPTGHGTGAWSMITGGSTIVNSLANATTAIGLGSGPNVFRWTVTKEGCERFADVTVNNNSVTAKAGSDQPIVCGTEALGYSTKLDAVKPDATLGWTGLWTNNLGSGTFEFPTLYNTDVSYPGGANRTGHRIFRWTIAGQNGSNVVEPYCYAHSDVDVYVYVPTESNAGADIEDCLLPSGVVTLNGNDPIYGVGEWSWNHIGSIRPIFTHSNQHNTTVTNFGLNETVLRWTIDNNTCISSDEMSVINNYVFADAGPDEDICGDTYTLNGNKPNDFGFSPTVGYATGRWAIDDATGTFVDPTLYNTVINGLRSSAVGSPNNSLIWRIEKGGCSDDDDIVITNNEIKAIAGPNQYICQPDATLSGNNVSIANGSGVWTWSNSAVVTNPSTNITAVTNLQSGLNTFTWNVTSDAGNCTDDESVEIYNHSVIAGAGFDVETCDPSADIKADIVTKPGATGVWTRFDGNSVTFADSRSNATNVSGLSTGSYTLRWTVTYTDARLPGGQCDDSDDMVLLNSSPKIAASASASDTETCGEDGQLHGTPPDYGGGERGLWTGGLAGSVINNPSSENTTVSNMPIGDNTFTWTLYRGVNITCPSSDQVTITNNYVIADAGLDKDAESCNDFTNLLADNPESTQGNGVWTDQTIGGTAIFAENTLFNTLVTNLKQGVNTFRWMVSKGTCPPASDDVLITNNQVTATIMGGNQTTCDNSYGPLTGNDPTLQDNPATGQWSTTIAGITFDEPSSYNTFVRNLPTGDNLLKWTVTSNNGGCDAEASIIITNNSIDAFAGLDDETCFADYQLNATQPVLGTGAWTKSSGGVVTFDDSNVNNTYVRGLTGGQYTFTWTVSYNTCSKASQVIITNNTPQKATANASPLEVCDGNGNLFGNAAIPGDGETGKWSLFDAGGSVIFNDASNVTTVSNMKLGNNIFRWTISKGTTEICHTEADVTITNNEITTVDANSGDGIHTTCDGTIILRGTDLSGENADRGLWQVDNGVVLINNNTVYQTNAINLQAGPNIFTWTLYKGICDNSASVTITNDQVIADIKGPLNTERCDGTVVLSANPLYGAGVWSLVSGAGSIQNSMALTTSVTGLEKNNNIFRWTIDNGLCNDTDEITITNNQVFPQANNKDVCESSTTLPGIDPSIIDNNIDNQYWTDLSGSGVIIQNSNQYNSVVSNLAPNVNGFRWTLVKGNCSSFVDIQIDNQGVVASANDVNTCVMPVQLDGSPPPAGATGQWSHVAGTYTFVDDNTLYNAQITDIPNGNSASLVWTVTKGACSDATDPITVSNNNFALSAGNDEPTCDGEIQLNGQDIAGGTGFWQYMSGNAIFDNSTVRDTWARSLANNDNVLRWTVDNGNCTNYADVTISNYQVVAQLSSANMLTCGPTATLNAIDPTPNSGTWSSLDATANPPVVATPSAYNSLVTGLKPGGNQFQWHVSGNGSCSDDVVLTIVNDTVILASTVETTEICADFTNLWANDPAPNSGKWNSVGLNAIVQNSTQYDTPISNLDKETNTFYWTVTSVNNGCKSTQRFDVINNLPDPANAGADKLNYCFDYYQLNGNSPLIGTGVWSPVSGGGNIADPTLRNTMVSNLQAGANEFKWTITSDKDNTCTTEDNIIINSNAIQADAGLDQPDLCGTSTTITAMISDPTESGYWTLIGGNAIIVNSLLASTLVNDLGKGNNTFRWHISNPAGCTDEDDVLVVNNIPVKPSTDPDIDDCFFAQSVNASPPPVGGTGLWTRVAGSGTFDNPTNYNPVVISGLSNQNINQFEWTVTTNGCSNSDIITIVNNGVSADADPDASTCDDFYTLKATAPDAGVGVWTVSSGNGVISNSLNNETLVTNLDQGANGFTWTVTRGACTDLDELVITNNSPTVSNAGTDINTCDASESLLANNPGVGAGYWTKSNGSTATIDVPSLYNTSITIPVKANPYSEIFTWTITNPNGSNPACVSSSTVTVNQNSFINSANADDYTCDGTYNLLGRDPGNVSPSATGLWSVTVGSGTFDNSMAYNATVSGLSDDANTLVWTITNVVSGGPDCDVPEEVIITNNQVIAQANEGASASICDDFRPITANNPALLSATGVWTLPSPDGQTIDNASAFNTTVRNLKAGTNRLVWTVTKNLCSKSEILDIEYYMPNANITMGDVVHQCSAETPLTADAPPATGSGLWALKFPGAAIIADNSLANTTASNLDIKDNVFVWTVTDRGCSAFDEVSVNNSMPINSDGSDQADCTAGFNMNAQVPTVTGSGLWTVVTSPGAVSIVDNTLASTHVAVPYGTTQLKWTITDNGCSADKLFNITNNKPNAVAGNGQETELCDNFVQLSGNVPNAALGESGAWIIVNGATTEIFDDSTSPTATVTNLRQGRITFRWTVTNANCSSSADAVYINNTPYVYAGNDRTICASEVNLAGNVPEPGAAGLWEINSQTVQIDNNTLNNTHVSVLGNNNLFTWTIDNGKCEASDQVLITSRAFNVSAGLVYQEACADTLVLDATNPADVGTGTGTGSWLVVEGSGSVDDISNFATIARNLRGYNKLRWTITDYPENCQYYGETAFQSLLPTVIAKTADDKSVCADFTQITASEPNYPQGETGLWEPVAVGSNTHIDTPTAFQTQVTQLGAGINVFSWTISNANCDDTDNISITNNQVFADAGTNQPTVCDSSATISANLTAGTGYWTTTSPTAIILESLNVTTGVEHLNFGDNNFQWNVNQNGCTDVDQVIVTSILPRNVYAGDNQDICSDDANLTGSNPGIGTGLWRVVSGGTNTVVAEPSANHTTVTKLARGENRFTWTVTVNGCPETDEVGIYNNSIYVTAGTDQTICNQDTLVLNGTRPGPGVTGHWDLRGGSGVFDNLSVYNTVVRDIGKEINTYRWTLADGNCSNYAEVKVTNNTPDSAIVGNNQFICRDSTIINAQPVSIGIGRWKVSSGEATIFNPDDYNAKVGNIKKGTTDFKWIVTKNGCVLDSIISVTNNSVDAYIADPEVVICNDAHTATIIGNQNGPGEIGYWTKQNPAAAGIIVHSASNVTDVTNLANGATYFTWTIENGSCTNSAPVKVTDNYYNTTANPAGPNVLCENYSPILGGTPPPGGAGLWSSTAPDVTFDSDTKVSTIVRNLPGGTTAITWTVTKDGCSAPAGFNLVNNAIYASAGKDQIVCQNSTNMNAQLLAGESGQWIVDNMIVVITDTSDPTTAVSNLIPGNNTFTWTISANGCIDSDKVIVSDNSFSVTAGNDDIACGTSYNLAASDPLSGTGLWTVPNGQGRFVDASNYQTVVYDMENGVNTFNWKVKRNSCEDDEDVVITNNLYIAVAGDDKPICSDQTTVSAQPLNPTWGASGFWTAQIGGGVFTDPSSESTLVSGLASGDNRLRWTVTKTESGKTCTSYDEMIVTNNSVTASAGFPQTTCDDFITLGATPLSPTGVGLWSGGGVNTIIVEPSSATTLVTDLQQGTNTFAWTVKDLGCEGTSTVKITSNYFVADAGASQVVTVNSAVMSATLPDATATGTWTPFSGDGSFADNTNPTETVTALGFGVNTFRWKVIWKSCPAHDDVDITYNAITADAGPAQTICEGETYMHANNPAPGTGRWSINEGSASFDNITDPNTRVYGIKSGSLNIFRWTVEIGGYSVSDDVTVLNGEFTISAGSDKEECYDSSTMTAESAGNGQGTWTVDIGGGSFADNSLNTTVVTGLNEGKNLFIWTVQKQCTNSDTVQITYNLPPTAGFDMDQSAGCTPIDVEFTNTSVNGETYYWNFGDDFRTDTSLITFTRTYEALYDKDSTYNVQLVAESSKGCYDTIVQQVTTYRIPLVGFSATPISQLFPRSEITIENLSGDGYLNYYWDMDDGNTYLHSSMVETFSHKFDSWGEYTITLSVFSNNCSDTARQTVFIVAPQPVTTIKPGLRAKGCEDLSVYFEAFVNYADTFHWDFGDGGSSEEQDPTYIYDTPGTYIVTLSASGPGTDTLVVVRRDTVQVFEVPVADFEAIPDTVMLPNQPVILHNNSISADIYRWNFGSTGSEYDTLKSPNHYYTEEGIYTITLDVWTKNGCHDSKTIENAVVVEPAGTFQFPSAINPFSNTQVNRVFKPKHRGIREYKLEIYNRWGEKVFESTDTEVGWDGYIDGKIGAQDVYVWKVSGKYKNGILFKKTGDVTLLR